MTTTFDPVWNHLQSHLHPGMVIKNWTVFNGYIGKDPIITHLNPHYITADPDSGAKLQRILLRDFEAVWEVWVDNKNSKVPREELRDLTRFSKYIISILHRYDQ